MWFLNTSEGCGAGVFGAVWKGVSAVGADEVGGRGRSSGMLGGRLGSFDVVDLGSMVAVTSAAFACVFEEGRVETVLRRGLSLVHKVCVFFAAGKNIDNDKGLSAEVVSTPTSQGRLDDCELLSDVPFFISFKGVWKVGVTEGEDTAVASSLTLAALSKIGFTCFSDTALFDDVSLVETSSVSGRFRLVALSGASGPVIGSNWHRGSLSGRGKTFDVTT